MNPDLRYPKDAVFIVGTSRSGTTLMQTLLNASEDIRICPETNFLGNVMMPYYQYRPFFRRGRRWRILSAYVKAPCFKDSGVDPDGYLRSMTEVPLSGTAGLAMLLTAFSKKNQLTRVGEKSPGQLYIAHRLLQEFGGSKLVAMVRDPRAVYASLIKTPFGPEWLSLFIAKWKRDFRLVQALKRLYPTRVLPVFYEELVQTPMDTMRKVTGFVGVRFSEEMLRPARRHLLGIDFQREPWKVNVTSPITPKNKLKWRSELSQGEISFIENCCGKEICSIRGAAAPGSEPMQNKVCTIWMKLLSAALQFNWTISRFPWKREVAAILRTAPGPSSRGAIGSTI